MYGTGDSLSENLVTVIETTQVPFKFDCFISFYNNIFCIITAELFQLAILNS